MERSLFHLSAVSAAQLPSGFAGETLISVMDATKNSYQVSMYQGSQKISCRNAKGKEFVPWEASMEATELSFA